MAVTVASGVRVTNTQLKAWKRAIESGKRSAFEIERNELGTTGRGKTVTRLIASELD